MRPLILVLSVLLAFILSACAQNTSSIPADSTEVTPSFISSTSAPVEISPSTSSPEPAQPSTPTLLSPEERPPSGAEREFSTDFSIHSVPYSEILSGGPPKDGIPAIDEPLFVTIDEADKWLNPVEPVVALQIGNDARAYPIQIFIWHEIVNDIVDNQPVVITFCPLCNTAIAFDATFNGQKMDFGTTGRLRYSNLIMYDRQTETWWQQATGDAIAGSLTGSQLTYIPVSIISWRDFKQTYPDGQVLSKETGYVRSYGSNPYVGYDDINASPFLYRGPRIPDQLPPMTRVLTVDLNGEAVAYPYDTMQTVHVANDVVGGQPVAVFWAGGVASPLDAGSTAGGRDVGTAIAYASQVDGQTLTFVYNGEFFQDDQTGSTWNELGLAVDGPLADTQLQQVVSINHFWFSWAAFRPETRVFQP